MKKSIGAVVASSAMLLAACGSSGTTETLASEGAAQPADVAAAAQGDLANAAPITGDLRSVLLDKALDPATEISSARFEGRLSFVGTPESEMPGEVSIVFSGAYDLNADATEFSMDLSGIVDALPEAEMALMAGFFSEPMQTISIGDQSWMKWGLFSMFTGGEDAWIEGEASDVGEAVDITGLGGGSPVEMLDALADADAVIEVVGAEDLRGVTTTHYRAIVDPVALVDSMSADDQESLATDLGGIPNAEFPMEFWLDENGLVHRFMMDFSDPGILGEDSTDVESAEFVFDMWDHGADIVISPPPADEVVSLDDQMFGFLTDET